ncbi:MAG TPA: gamma-glutamyltransferase [Polyangiaceae bacterium]|jgi:gamma-glutamyltranspeptidase/glutathione hydrolase|nr:gamma-glutamyltransferase [Polyangiaceae bacterium]
MRSLISTLLLGSLALGGCTDDEFKVTESSTGASSSGSSGTSSSGSSSSSGGGEDGGPPPITPPPATFVPTAVGTKGAAATVDQRGTWAAIETLKAGGNAVDAAVAAASTLGVTDPFSCGIGGGGFMLVYIAATGQVVAIDHRETVPLGMDHTAFYEKGAALTFADLLTSGLSVGVPGTVRGWDEALRRYGSLGWKDVLKYAAYVAEQGFEVDKTFFDQTTRNLNRFREIESTAKLFLTGEGEPLPVGTLLKNPDLAAVYNQIGDEGAKAFYEGAIAQAIVNTVKTPPVVAGSPLNVRPGFMELSDLALYEARIRTPVKSDYRGYTVYGVPLPTSGGLTIALALNLLSGFDPGTTDKAGWLHRYIEASRLAYADRNTYMGDPAFVSVPDKGLISMAYADARRPLIDLAKASNKAANPGDPFMFQDDQSGKLWSPSPSSFVDVHMKDELDTETTHITVSDEQGNVVSYTCTIEYEGGNGMVVPGHGFLLNNELTDFNVPANPATVHPNVLEPGKRPRSSMSPTIVFKDGKPALALGTPGGATIITTVLQILVNHIDLGMPIDEAIAAARVSQRNSPDATSGAEPAFIMGPDAAALQALGHLFSDMGIIDGAIGAATAIKFNDDGTLTAAAEPVRRGGGSAMVVVSSEK